MTGGKAFDDWEKAKAALDYWDARLQITRIVQGGHISLDPAEGHLPLGDRRKWGAQWMAKRWAMTRGIPFVDETLSSDEMKKLGASALATQNRRMLDRHKPHRVIAFAGDDGAVELLNQARASSVRCIEVA